MTIGSSIFLIALGAIPRYAVTATFAGVDVQVVGVILMIAGLIGLVVGLFMYFNAAATRRRGGRPPTDAPMHEGY